MVAEEYEDNLILNRYRPISQVGSGGYGTVVVAWDTRIQRRVAIKMMQLETDENGALDQDAAQAGLEEARTAAMLTDANIVGVFDFEVQGTTAYLIMEYVDGITLTQLMRDWGDYMTADVVAAIFQDVAHALEVAHENQVLHLDIKPDNILISRTGEVKVTDFGLAKLSDAAGFSQAGGGTIGYMPLEQMRLEPLDARCDEWSLASITYQMISGENPFFAKDLPAAEAAIKNAEVILPSLSMEGLDEEVDDVLFYALDPDRNERYSSVHDFAEELQPLLGDAEKGHAQLARIVGQAREDMPEEAAPDSDVPTRVEGKPMKDLNVVLRLWSAACAGLLGFVALANNAWVPGIQSAPFWGVLVAIVLLAVFVPHIGAALASVAFAVALISHELYIPAAVLILATALWWFFIARDAFAQANTGMSSVLFGVVGLNHVVPLLAGYYLDVRQAIGTTLFASLLAVLLAALGSGSIEGWWPTMFWRNLGPGYNDALIAILRDTNTWITFGSWILATIIMAALCGFGKKGLGVLGAILAGAVLVAGVVGCTYVSSNYTNYYPALTDIALPIVCAVAVAVLCALKAPEID